MMTALDEQVLPLAEPPASRRRLAVVLITAAVILLIAEVGVRIIENHLPEPLEWHSFEAQRKVDQMDELADRGGADVVFLGSSMMNVALDPALFEQLLGDDVIAYNAALSSATPVLDERWALDVVIPRLHPKVLVVGVSSFDFAEFTANGTSFYTAFMDSPAGRRATNRDSVLDEIDHWIEGRSALWAHRFELREPSMVFDAVRGRTHAVVPPEVNAIEPNGHQGLLRDYAFEERVLGVGLPVDGWTLGSADPAALERLIDSAAEQGIQVVLVDMPVTDEFVSRHPHGSSDYQLYLSTLRGLADRSNAPVVELNGIRDHSLFGDEVHLNRRGTPVFTTRVADALRAEGLVP